MNRPIAILLFLWGFALPVAARPDGQLELTIVDEATNQPIAARMTLRDPRGRPMVRRGVGVAPLGDHFYVDGRLLLALRRGQYRFDMDAGPDYHPQSGHFEIQRRSEDTTEVAMRRAVNLKKEGWIGADLDAPRATPGLATAMRAELLGHTARIAWRHDGAKWQSVDDRPSRDAADATSPTGAAWGNLRFYPPEEPPLDTKQLARIELSAERLAEMRANGWRIVAADLTDWRLPVWLAYDALDAAMIIDRASLADREPRTPAGRPRDKAFYPGMRGVGRWREAIYFHVLNAGLRLTPVAGSGSGETESPLGSARVYAHSDGEADSDAWWSAIAHGATFVTTGPLLRPSVQGAPPGREFYLDAGATTDFQVALSLTTRDKIEYLELLKNGEVAASVALRDVAKSGGRLPPLAFEGPGWFAVRAAPTKAKAKRKFYHRALTAPYYVTQGGDLRISKQSCQFFLTWLDEVDDRVNEAEIATARSFWTDQLRKANAP